LIFLEVDEAAGMCFFMRFGGGELYIKVLDSGGA